MRQERKSIMRAMEHNPELIAKFRLLGIKTLFRDEARPCFVTSPVKFPLFTTIIIIHQSAICALALHPTLKTPGKNTR